MFGKRDCCTKEIECIEFNSKMEEEEGRLEEDAVISCGRLGILMN